MDEKKYVICQGTWILTPALSEAKADIEKKRLSVWFSGLTKIDAEYVNSEQWKQKEG